MIITYWKHDDPEDEDIDVIRDVDSIDFHDDHIVMYKKNKQGIFESIGTLYIDDLDAIDER